MKKIIFVASVLFTVSINAQVNRPTTTTSTETQQWSHDDQQFLEKATQGALLEINNARMALNQTKDESIHKFANQMITDHRNALDQLAKSVNKETFDKASQIPQVSNALAQQRDEAFNNMYKQQAIKSHKETITLYENYIRTSNNPQLKAWAEKNLPVVRMHLDHAEKL